MKTLLVLILGIIIGVAAVWYFGKSSHDSRMQNAGQQIETAARSAGDSIQEKLHALKLDTGSITNELARTGKVIRQKTHDAGQAISDATADTRITAAIKTKLVKDPDLSAWDISVNTTDGVVTLSGSVSSPEHIGKAMALALDTDGVREAMSTLQVKPK